MPGQAPTHVSNSDTWTFFEGEWHAGNVALMGPRTHGAWMGSTVFDGARRFEGVAPDLDLHCARINASATAFGLEPMVAREVWIELAREGMQRFDRDAALYVRPMYWAEGGKPGGGVVFDPSTTRWCLCLYEAPMPPGDGGLSITLSPYRRPTAECAPVEAKAGCLYPLGAHALMEAQRRGFDNCLLRDMLGNVAELANANVFMVRDGVAFTPIPNGTFLAGITRRRVIALLRAAGVEVVETILSYADFLAAEEIFSCGNFAKLRAVVRIDDRKLTPGPLFMRARALYREFAHG